MSIHNASCFCSHAWECHAVQQCMLHFVIMPIIKSKPLSAHSDVNLFTLTDIFRAKSIILRIFQFSPGNIYLGAHWKRLKRRFQ